MDLRQRDRRYFGRGSTPTDLVVGGSVDSYLTDVRGRVRVSCKRHAPSRSAARDESSKRHDGSPASAASGGSPSTAESGAALAKPAVVLGTVRVYAFVLDSPMDAIAAANEPGSRSSAKSKLRRP